MVKVFINKLDLEVKKKGHAQGSHSLPSLQIYMSQIFYIVKHV
jgi:hypothetical protein